jgi:hypothetical protein
MYGINSKVRISSINLQAREGEGVCGAEKLKKTEKLRKTEK